VKRHPWRIIATLMLGYGAVCTLAGIGVYALLGKIAWNIFLVAAIIGATPFGLWVGRRYPWNPS